MGAGAVGDKAEQESSLTQAQASLLDMADSSTPAADGAAALPPPAPAATAAAAGSGGGGLGGLDDLLSLGGSGAGAPAGAATPVQAAGAAADFLGDLMGGPAPAAGGSAAPAAPAAAPTGGGLGGLEDLLGGLGGGSTGARSAPAASPRGSGVELLPQPQLTPQEFQQSWAAWTPGQRTINQPLGAAAVASVEANGFKVRKGGERGGPSGCGERCPSRASFAEASRAAIIRTRARPLPKFPPAWVQDFTAHIGQANVATFATPREGSAPPLRFLFHAQAAGSGARVLVQVRSPAPGTGRAGGVPPCTWPGVTAAGGCSLRDSATPRAMHARAPAALGVVCAAKRCCPAPNRRSPSASPHPRQPRWSNRTAPRPPSTWWACCRRCCSRCDASLRSAAQHSACKTQGSCRERRRPYRRLSTSTACASGCVPLVVVTKSWDMKGWVIGGGKKFRRHWGCSGT